MSEETTTTIDFNLPLCGHAYWITVEHGRGSKPKVRIDGEVLHPHQPTVWKKTLGDGELAALHAGATWKTKGRPWEAEEREPESRPPQLTAEPEKRYRIPIGDFALIDCLPYGVVDDLVLWKGKLGSAGKAGWLLTSGGGPSVFPGFIGEVFGDLDGKPIVEASENVAELLRGKVSG